MVNRRTSSRRPLNWLSVLGLLQAGLLLAGLANAAGNDTEAKELSEKALFDDYLNLRFDDAEAKLKQAIALCETGCSPKVVGQLYRDLGVVYVAGKQSREDGVQAFAQAIAAYPSVELDPDLSTAEIESAFEEARSKAGSVEPSPVSAAAPTGLIEHTPPEEQVVNTPLPLFVATDDGSVSKVTAFVRGFGMPDYKEIPLKKHDGGFGAETSCRDVGGTTGEFQYYIVAYDSEGAAVGKAGSQEDPFVVTIKKELDGDPPHLPGSAPPEQCASVASAADCPPDFPGCESNLGEWGAGEELPPEVIEGDFTKHWLSLSFQADFLLLPASNDTCSRERTEDWECFHADGSFRNPIINQAGFKDPTSGEWRGAGSTDGGPALATLRVLLGYDYAVTQSVRLGARVGFAFRGRPTLITTEVNEETMMTEEVSQPPFIPVHAEARLAYWFGDDNSAVRPHLGISGGLAQVDAKLVVSVVDNNQLMSPTECPRDAAGELEDPRCSLSNVEAWNSTGPFFAAGSAGLMIPFGASHGFDIEAKFMTTFPNSGLGLGAAVQAGYLIGL